MKHKNDLSYLFKKISKLDIDVFIGISYTIFLIVFGDTGNGLKNYGILTDDIELILSKVFGKEQINNYFKLVSISKENAESVIQENNQIRNYDLHPFEISIFTRKPFLYHKSQYRILKKEVLHHHFNFFLYEYLKMNYGNEFTTEFGNRVEKYVKLGLDDLKVSYITESKLKNKIGKHESVVDYVINDNILVDVKAIELRPYEAINPTKELLANHLKDSITKAYAKQMINVAHKLDKNREYFGIIITYKELRLDNGRELWNLFLRDETLKMRSEEDIKVLPIDNLFMMDLKTWDYLTQYMKDTQISLLDILRKVREDNLKPDTMKFEFQMHINKYLGKINLSYLRDAETKL